MVSSGTSDTNFRLGLIAGRGSLPIIVCQTAARRGVETTAITFHEETTQNLKGLADVTQIGIGEAGKAIKRFKDAGVKKICLVGKIEKSLVFKNPKLDAYTLKVLMKRTFNKSDSALMLIIIEELEKAGFEVVKQTDWLPDLLPTKGILGKVRPDKDIQSDFEFGMDICRKTAGMDIGQTIIVKDGAVIAVEAVEGTDWAIKRGCELAKGGAVMIKASRPKQDFRFDIPSIGPDTVKLLAKYKASGIAVEAGRTVVVDLPEVVSICNKANMAIVAL